jgi:O-antigen/teichoic acid export membrane protein
LSMVAMAVGQVLFVRSAQRVREGAPLLPELLPVLRILIAVAVAVVLLVTTCGAFLFTTVFGERWAMAGEFSTVLVIGYAMQLVGMPFGVVLIALRKVPATLIFPLCFAGLLAFVPLFAHWEPMPFMGVLSAVEVIAYAVQAAVVFLFVRRYDRSIAARCARCSRTIR